MIGQALIVLNVEIESMEFREPIVLSFGVVEVDKIKLKICASNNMLLCLTPSLV